MERRAGVSHHGELICLKLCLLWNITTTNIDIDVILEDFSSVWSVVSVYVL